MKRSIPSFSTLLLASITLTGCATTIITKAEFSDAEIESIRCEPIALTVYHRILMRPAGDTSIRVSYRPDLDLRDKVIAERRRVGCTEDVEIRDIKAEKVNFKYETFPIDMNPVMNIVPQTHRLSEGSPQKTTDQQFAEYLNAAYPKNDKKWIQMGFRSQSFQHDERVLSFIIHGISLGFIPIWENEDYDLEVRVIGRDRKTEVHEVTLDSKIWTWLPFVFRSDGKTLSDAEKKLRFAPVKRVIEGMKETAIQGKDR